MRYLFFYLLIITTCGGFLAAQDAGTKDQPAPAPANTAKADPAKAEKADKDDTKKGRKKNTIRMADDKDDPPPVERDPGTYELSNKRLLEEYSKMDAQPFDRGEHIMVSAFFGALGGAVVGGLTGFSQFDKNDMTASQNGLYLYGGIGAGVGAVSGVLVTFFERGKVEQFAIGKFLLKNSWYGAVGGAALGAGIGLIPYSSSQDYGDIFRYGGYGAGIGFAVGLVMFAIDLPDHLRLFTYRREDQNMLALTIRF